MIMYVNKDRENHGYVKVENCFWQLKLCVFSATPPASNVIQSLTSVFPLLASHLYWSASVVFVFTCRYRSTLSLSLDSCHVLFSSSHNKSCPILFFPLSLPLLHHCSGLWMWLLIYSWHRCSDILIWNPLIELWLMLKDYICQRTTVFEFFYLCDK